jgi:hypothetical protein
MPDEGSHTRDAIGVAISAAMRELYAVAGEERVNRLLDSPHVRTAYGVPVDATREQTAAAIEQFHADHEQYLRRLAEQTEELKRNCEAREVEAAALEIELDIREVQLRLARASRALQALNNHEGN